MLLLDCFQLKTLCFAGIVLELRTSPKTFDLAQQREVCGKAKGRRQPPVQSLLYISFAAGSFRKQGRGGGRECTVKEIRQPPLLDRKFPIKLR